MYFVVVTISTVGYGDYSPVTFPGRLVVCFMIIGFMVIVPVKISELADLLAMRSPWFITYHSKIGYRNILLIGSVLEVAEVEAFLEEFFHPDRMRLAQDISLPSTDLVIMAPHDPSEAMVSLLFVPFWQGQVHYINGSALDDRDLKRAGCRTADACFVLVGKRSSPPRSLNDSADHQELIDHYDSQVWAPPSTVTIIVYVFKLMHCYCVVSFLFSFFRMCYTRSWLRTSTIMWIPLCKCAGLKRSTPSLQPKRTS
jgi:hypothetical protein